MTKWMDCAALVEDFERAGIQVYFGSLRGAPRGVVFAAGDNGFGDAAMALLERFNRTDRGEFENYLVESGRFLSTAVDNPKPVR